LETGAGEMAWKLGEREDCLLGRSFGLGENWQESEGNLETSSNLGQKSTNKDGSFGISPTKAVIPIPKIINIHSNFPRRLSRFDKNLFISST
jgi:hypothetical protein